MSETFREQLLRIRRDRGVSRSTLSRLTVQTGDMGVSEAAIEKLETDPRRRPADRTIVLLGRALDATDQEFPAYALARARQALDESVVGQDQALAALNAVQDRLDLASAERSAERDFGEDS